MLNLWKLVEEPIMMPLPACVPWMPESEVNSESGSEVTAAQGIDPMDKSGLDIGLGKILVDYGI